MVDTNLWGNGILDTRRLTILAEQVAKVGVRVWIPTQVVLEWASHAFDDIKLAEPIWKRLRRSGVLNEAPLLPADVHAVMAELTARIKAIPNVRILPMGGDAAIAGLTDQILGTGSGTRKSGVKTGGVDSAFVRDVLEQVDNDPNRVVFISGNAKDLQAVAKRMGVGDLVVRNEQNLASSLFFKMSASNDVQQYIAGEFWGLATIAPASDDPHSQMDHPFFNDSWFGISDVEITDTGLSDTAPFDITEVQLEPGYYRLVGLRSMEIYESEEGDPHSGSVDFEALLIGPVGVSGYELDSDGEVVMRDGLLGDVLITAPFSASVIENRVTFNPAGTAYVREASIQFDQGADALEWLEGFITSLVGVKDANDSSWVDDELVLQGVNGRRVTAELAGDGDEWTLSFDLGDDIVKMSCSYDPDSRVWAGKDSFDRYPPYHVTGEADSGATHGPYETIALVWRHLVEPVEITDA